MPKSPVKMTHAEMQRTTEEIVRVLGVDISVALKEYFPGSKFVLVIFPTDNPKVCNYITNAKQEEVLEATKSISKKLTPEETDNTISRAIH
jgi:hypothetical protein